CSSVPPGQDRYPGGAQQRSEAPAVARYARTDQLMLRRRPRMPHISTVAREAGPQYLLGRSSAAPDAEFAVLVRVRMSGSANSNQNCELAAERRVRAHRARAPQRWSMAT